MQYRVEGFAELERKLRALGNETAGEALIPAIRAAGNVIRDEARRRAPVKTGRLRRSIGTRINKRLTQGAEAVIRVSRRAFYGRFIELGAEQHVIEPKGEKHVRAALRRLARKGHTRNAKVWDRALDTATNEIAEIRARSHGLLANRESGEIFGGRVRHPGTRPQPFLRPAIDVKGQAAIDTLRDRLMRNIEKIARSRR